MFSKILAIIFVIDYALYYFGRLSFDEYFAILGIIMAVGVFTNFFKALKRKLNGGKLLD